jgi:hypothetical protein
MERDIMMFPTEELIKELKELDVSMHQLYMLSNSEDPITIENVLGFIKKQNDALIKYYEKQILKRS